MAQLKPGVKAPNFNLTAQDGKKVSLAKFKGKRLLVYFYPKADTPGCAKQACSVRDAAADMKKLKLAAVGISPDPPAKQEKFDAKHGLGFPLLSDEDHKVAKAYGAWGKKSMYGKTYEGIIRSAFLVDEKGKIAGAWYKVKPNDTMPNVMSAIE